MIEIRHKQTGEVLHRVRGDGLAGAWLRRLTLQHADLRGADLRGADLKHSRMLFADLTGADLRRVDLRGAILDGANLEGTDLRGADLRQASVADDLCGIICASFRCARHTRWPVGFDPQKAGAVLVD